jgi:uncharacterized membrane protein YbjE (DUF340 family)
MTGYVRVSACSSVLFLIICVLLNVATVMAYRRKYKVPLLHNTQQQQQTQQNAERETIERKLLVYSVCTFFGHFLIAILMILVSFHEGKNLQKWHFSLLD